MQPWPAPPTGLEHAPRLVPVDPSTPGSARDLFATTGLFAVGAASHTIRDLRGIDCLGLDADASDWLVHEGRFSQPGLAKVWMAQGGSTEVEELLVQHRELVAQVVQEAGFGVTRMVYSGYGHHVWIHLDRPVLSTDPNFGAVLLGVEAMVDVLNRRAGFKIFDTAAKDAGTRLLRPIGAYNSKRGAHRVTKLAGWSDYRLAVEDLVQVVAAYTGSNGIKIVAKAAGGRPLVTRTGPQGQSGGRYEVRYVDLATMRTNTGRTYASIAEALQPGHGVQAPSPEGRDGDHGCKVVKSTSGQVEVIDFPRMARYIHCPPAPLLTTDTELADFFSEVVVPAVNRHAEWLAERDAAYNLTAEGRIQTRLSQAADRHLTGHASLEREPVQLPDSLDDLLREVEVSSRKHWSAQQVRGLAAARKACPTGMALFSRGQDQTSIDATSRACLSYGCAVCGAYSLASAQAAYLGTLDHLVSIGWVCRTIPAEHAGSSSLEAWIQKSPTTRGWTGIPIADDYIYIFHADTVEDAPAKAKRGKVASWVAAYHAAEELPIEALMGMSRASWEALQPSQVAQAGVRMLVGSQHVRGLMAAARAMLLGRRPSLASPPAHVKAPGSAVMLVATPTTAAQAVGRRLQTDTRVLTHIDRAGGVSAKITAGTGVPAYDALLAQVEAGVLRAPRQRSSGWTVLTGMADDELEDLI